MLNPSSPLKLRDASLLRQANLIDGAWVQADSGRTIEVRNPANGELVGEVPAAGVAETRRAIEAAFRAQKAWRKLTAKERQKPLRRPFRPDDGEPGGSGHHHDGRARQAALREPR